MIWEPAPRKGFKQQTLTDASSAMSGPFSRKRFRIKAHASNLWPEKEKRREKEIIFFYISHIEDSQCERKAIAAVGYDDLDSSRQIGLREKHGNVAADLLAPIPEPGRHIEKMVK